MPCHWTFASGDLYTLARSQSRSVLCGHVILHRDRCVFRSNGLPIHRSVSLEAFVPVLKNQITFHGILWVAIVWFVATYTGTVRRWLAVTVTAAYAVAVIINIVSPYGILYSKIDSFNSSVLPWGEHIAFVDGPPHPWRLIADSRNCYKPDGRFVVLTRHARLRFPRGLDP